MINTIELRCARGKQKPGATSIASSRENSTFYGLSPLNPKEEYWTQGACSGTLICSLLCSASNLSPRPISVCLNFLSPHAHHCVIVLLCIILRVPHSSLLSVMSSFPSNIYVVAKSIFLNANYPLI